MNIVTNGLLNALVTGWCLVGIVVIFGVGHIAIGILGIALMVVNFLFAKKTYEANLGEFRPWKSGFINAVLAGTSLMMALIDATSGQIGWAIINLVIGALNGLISIASYHWSQEQHE